MKYNISKQQESNQYGFSIIIPVLNEAGQINSLIEHLQKQNHESSYEIIVVDGDPQGSTIHTIQDKDVTTITADKGRGKQMNAGAAVACGEILIFLHADTTLPDNALEKINQAMQDLGYVGVAFDLKIDSDRLFLKYISARASLRSRWNRIPYGDQAIFIRKNYFDQIGGFKEIPLEDVELMHEEQQAKSLRLPFSKIASVIHAYPSYSDVVRQPAKTLLHRYLTKHFLHKADEKSRPKKEIVKIQ